MGFGSDVLDCQLGQERALVVVEHELGLWHDVDEVRADIETGAEQMRMRLEILIATAIIVTFTLRHDS